MSLEDSKPSAAVRVEGSVGLGRPKANNLHQYFLHLFDEAEVAILCVLIIEFIIDCAVAFNIVERPSFRRLMNFLRPGVQDQVPKRTCIGTTILRKRFKEAEERRDANIDRAKAAGHYLGLIVDGWDTVNKSQLEGVMLKAGMHSYLLDAIDPGTEHHGIAVAKMWENIFVKNAAVHMSRLRYFISDNAGQCGRARRILALRHPYIVFMKCWAHQVNLMVGHLMKKSSFAEVCNSAVKCASDLTKSKSKWYAKLRNTCERIYGKSATSTITTLGDTRWNSLQACFATQLRIKKACSVFVLEHSDDPKFPQCLVDAWGNKSFWMRLEEAELLIRPLCDASFLMQREGNTMAHVLLLLINLYIGIGEFHGNEEHSASLTIDIEKRWKDVEQPLFVLCFLLHPGFYDTASKILLLSEKSRGTWNDEKNRLTPSRLTDAAVFYYQKHELWLCSRDCDRAKELQQFRLHIYLWLKRLRPMDQLFKYTPGDYPQPTVWWEVNAEMVGIGVANFAKFLLGCPVQSATCERLFKDFAQYLTKTRNRLSRDKLVQSTMIKYDMREKYPDDYDGSNGTVLHSQKNRHVNPEEHIRTEKEDGLLLDEAQEGEEGGSGSLGDDDESGSFAVDDDVELPAGHSFDIPLQYDTPQLRALLAAIQLVTPPDSDGYEVDDDSMLVDPGDLDPLPVAGDGDVNDFEAMAQRYAEREVLALQQQEEHEKRRDGLEELPDVNDANYPQENAAYFRNKRYVRVDKYELKDFIWDDVAIPPVMATFHH